MCQLCQTESSTEEIRLNEAEADAICEFSTEHEVESCIEPAVWELKERYVEGHLCEHHAEELTQMLGEGLMRLYEASGASLGETLKPIQTQVGCDQCDRPARYAQITIASTFLCARHRGFKDE